MEPLTLPLAFGCVLTFSQIDRALTDAEGREPDGVIYRTVTLTDARGHHHQLEPSEPGLSVSPGSYFDAGRSPDGLFASYIVFSQGATHNTIEVRFVSAKTCAPVIFVRVRDGAEVDEAGFEGWSQDAAHTVQVLGNARNLEAALPLDEAQLANPAIRE